MKLIVVRHGESEGNIKQGFISGRRDGAKLTEKGKNQIIRTAWELRKEKIDGITVSPVARAQETGEIFNQFIKTQSQTSEWLTELDHGIFEGHYWWEVIHKIPVSWRAKREDFRTPYPEGESMEMLINRVWVGLQTFISKSPSDSTFLLISHQAVIGAMKYIFLHGDPKMIQSQAHIDSFLKFLHAERLPNGGYIEAVYSKDSFSIIQEKNEFTQVKDSAPSVAFYMQGIFNSTNAAKVEQVEQTASENTVYKEKDTDAHIIKILHGKNTDASVRQIALYGYMHKRHLAVPLVKHFDRTRVFFETDVLIQDFVEGAESKLCAQEHPEKFTMLLQDVFEILQQIHRFPAEEVQAFWRPPVEPPFTDWKPFMQSNINLTIHTIQEDIFSKKVSDAIINTLSQLREYILQDTYKIVPIHGDLAAGNIIVHHEQGKCRLRRLIDFEWARLGDRLWDFAYYWGWLERENENVAQGWYSIMKQNFSAEELKHLNEFRILFHAWTVRDMDDYKGNSIRERRGKRSKEILETTHRS